MRLSKEKDAKKTKFETKNFDKLLAKEEEHTKQKKRSREEAFVTFSLGE